MTFSAQDLNTKIELQSVSYTQDPYGQMIPTWTTFAEAFAKVEPLVGNQFLAAAAIWPNVPLKVTIRWRSDLAVGQRALIRGEKFEIESIQNIRFRNREALLMVKRLPLQ